MTSSHTALIVEDEPEMAAEIADLLRSFGHGHIHVETLADARVHLGKGGFCYVLLDLQIKADSQSIKPRVESGMTLLREIRQRYPVRGPEGTHLMPVIVISGHGKEPHDIIGAFRDGIDDFIVKPLGAHGQDVGNQIRLALQKARRTDHAQCETRTREAAGSSCGASSKEQFWHLPDYSQVSLKGELYVFTGEIQRSAIRRLHAAARSEHPWLTGKILLKEAGSSDLSMRVANLFRRHPAWGAVIESNGRGQYRLRTE
jgi:DNA-binding response OmpR family regulator